jgi:hypothetical protein
VGTKNNAPAAWRMDRRVAPSQSIGDLLKRLGARPPICFTILSLAGHLPITAIAQTAVLWPVPSPRHHAADSIKTFRQTLCWPIARVLRFSQLAKLVGVRFAQPQGTRGPNRLCTGFEIHLNLISAGTRGHTERTDRWTIVLKGRVQLRQMCRRTFPGINPDDRSP